MTEPLRLREFRLLLAGFIVGQSMMPLQFVASIAWIQLVAPDDIEILMVGAIGTIRGIGMIGFGLFGGALADRFDRRRLLGADRHLPLARRQVPRGVQRRGDHAAPHRRPVGLLGPARRERLRALLADTRRDRPCLRPLPTLPKLAAERAL